MKFSDKRILITTSVGKYVWYPILQVVDFIEPNKKRASFTLQLDLDENTELGAMIKATTDMLKKLKQVRFDRVNKDKVE